MISSDKKRSFVVTLRGGRKLDGASFMLTYPPGHDQYKSTGEPKKEWLLRLAPGVDGPTWDPGGEEGPKYCRSVKSGRTMAEICRGERR
ncbi:hypothetical protein CcaverHIS631_0302560 [Cutaneotrichosporon cavernicola]|nr:hypothetical protein CcaverHIS631_0302560 [Cutaneotrichosporon cavernicola]